LRKKEKIRKFMKTKKIEAARKEAKEYMAEIANIHQV
jgi:hypothetical protein